VLEFAKPGQRTSTIHFVCSACSAVDREYITEFMERRTERAAAVWRTVPALGGREVPPRVPRAARACRFGRGSSPWGSIGLRSGRRTGTGSLPHTSGYCATSVGARIALRGFGGHGADGSRVHRKLFSHACTEGEPSRARASRMPPSPRSRTGELRMALRGGPRPAWAPVAVAGCYDVSEADVVASVWIPRAEACPRLARIGRASRFRRAKPIGCGSFATTLLG